MEKAAGNQMLRYPTAVKRKSDRELVVTRIFDAAPHLLFMAWSQPNLFRRWWVPEGAGMSLMSCDLDVRTGGTYRLVFGIGDNTMAFHGRYIEVIPDARIVWTNDEDEEGAVTTVTFEEQDRKTLLTFHEVYPSPQALEDAMKGAAAALQTQLDQLEALLPTL
jgi:uncharacterized protein YndB with AHSA1/START domain